MTTATFAGLPDFAAPDATAAATTYAPFGDGSDYVLPQALSFASDASGNPKLQLELVERFGDFSTTGGYAVLDQTLAWTYPLDDAMAQARKRAAGATVKALPINRGFARLYPTTAEVLPPSDALVPLELGWTSPDGVRYVDHLSLAAGELVKGSLAAGSLLLGVRVEFDAVGVAQRADARATFEPIALLAALLEGNVTRSMPAANVLAACAANALPFTLTGMRTPELAQALADRIIATYAALAPAPDPAGPAFVTFAALDVAQTQAVTWDISMPALAYRQWVYTLANSPALSAAVAANGISPFVKNVVVPPLEIGVYAIEVTANLPSDRTGVPEIGVEIEIDANPPRRPASIDQRVILSEPDDRGSALVHLSPSEPLAYSATAYAVVAAGNTVREYRGTPRRANDPWLQVASADFAIAFAHVTLSDRLAQIATVALDLSYDLGGVTTAQHFAVNAQRPGLALAIPRTAQNATLALTATPNEGGAPISLTSEMPTSRRLDFTDFSEYGPHTLAIVCDLAATDASLILDIESLDRSLVASGAPDQLLFTPSQPGTTWGFVASTPFRAAYRYRVSATAAAPATAWSPFLTPFEPLRLRPDGSTIPSGSAELATA